MIPYLWGLLDFSAAFDIIDHSLLLEKRMFFGFTPPAIMWIKSYLSNRTQRVIFNGSLSKIICLGRLLFSIFTNDMPLTLSKELQLVSEWVARNKLGLNISKT